MKFRCVKNVNMGLFSIAAGPAGYFEGVKYGESGCGNVRIREDFKNYIENSGMPQIWAEIPQRVLADKFEPVE